MTTKKTLRNTTKRSEWFHSGSPWVWLNAGAVAISLVLVLGLLGLIAVRGLGHFWWGIIRHRIRTGTLWLVKWLTAKLFRQIG